MKHRHLAAAIAGTLVFAAAPAGAVTLNFDELPVNTALSNQYAALGAVFSANAFSGPGSSSSGADWATNSDMVIVSSTGLNVSGLGTPSLVSGNILRSFQGYLGEDGDASFRITFTTPVSSVGATFAGVTTAADVRLYAYDGAALLGVVAGASSDAQFTLSYGAQSITSVVIAPGSFNDWVGVDNINFAPVPEPATFATLALGLAMLSIARRRRGR